MRGGRKERGEEIRKEGCKGREKGDKGKRKEREERNSTSELQ